MKYDVFISYSRKDTAIADKVCAAFDRAGIRYFIDRQGIGGGFEFPRVLAENIIGSRLFLLLASENAYASKFTTSEIIFAFNKKSKQSILPYIIDGSSLPLELEFTFAGINWRNIADHPIEPVLVNDILGLLAMLKAEEATSAPAQPAPVQPAPAKVSTAAPIHTPPPAPKVEVTQAPVANNAGATYDVVLLSPGAAKLACVMCLRDMCGFGLAESKNLCDNAPSVVMKGVAKDTAQQVVAELNHIGATAEMQAVAGAPTATTPATANVPPQSADGTYDVVLIDAGVAKLGCVKCVKELGGYSLSDAKGLVDEVPSVVLRGVSMTEAQRAVAELDDIGAKAEIQSPSVPRITPKPVQTPAPQPATPKPAATPTPKPAAPKPAANTYKVGDYYDKNGKRGVVFEVTADGLHGKIVSLDHIAGVRWSIDKNFGTLFQPNNPSKTRVGCDDRWNGMVNTRKIQQIDNWREKYPAFAWCCAKGEGWYLPAIQELDLLLLYNPVHDAVNKTLAQKGGTKLYNKGDEYKWYWSSNEENGNRNTAWDVTMHDSKATCTYKDNEYGYVRAVATF